MVLGLRRLSFRRKAKHRPHLIAARFARHGPALSRRLSSRNAPHARGRRAQTPSLVSGFASVPTYPKT